MVAAVDAGFSKAFLTIVDTHVTTVVSCAFLFLFGTGPVKGFAVTLVIGLIAKSFYRRVRLEDHLRLGTGRTEESSRDQHLVDGSLVPKRFAPRGLERFGILW